MYHGTIKDEHVELIRQSARAVIERKYGTFEASWPDINKIQQRVKDALRGELPEIQFMVMVSLMECQIRSSLGASGRGDSTQ